MLDSSINMKQYRRLRGEYRTLYLIGALLAGCGGAAAVQKAPEQSSASAVEQKRPEEEAVLVTFSDEEEVADQDGDGLPDDSDPCPQLPVAQGSDGCPKYIRLSEKGDRYDFLEPIEFTRRKHTISEESIPVLQELLSILAARQELVVRVEAHTFERTGMDENMALSKQQAEQVTDWLLQGGVAAGKLQSYGCGKNLPRFNIRGRQKYKNRRIEVRIVKPLPPTGYPSTMGCEPTKLDKLIRKAAAAKVASAPEPAAVAAPAKPAEKKRPPPSPGHGPAPAADKAEPELASAPAAAGLAGPEGDRDKDGVADARDRCPRSPGERSRKGCPKRHRLALDQGRIRLLRRARFVEGSASIKSRTAKLLQEIRDTLAVNPKLAVRIEVREGDAQLAGKRAGALRAWLAQNGIKTERLEAFGCPQDSAQRPVVFVVPREGQSALVAPAKGCRQVE